MSNLRKTFYFEHFCELHLSVTMNCDLSGSLIVILQNPGLVTDTWKKRDQDNYTQEITATGWYTVCDRGLARGIRFFIFLGASSLCRLVLLEHFTLTFLISVSRSNYSVIREAKELLAWVHINYCRLCTLEYKVAKYMLERPEFSSPGPIFLQIHSSSLTHFSFIIDFTIFFSSWTTQHLASYNINGIFSQNKYTANQAQS